MSRKTGHKLAVLKHVLSPSFYAHRFYIKYYDKCRIDENMILLESQHGTSLGGNIAAILRTLCEDEEFARFKIYVSVRKNTASQISSQWSGVRNAENRVHTVEFDSRKYFKILASAGYLINDNTFCPVFMKKPGQRYLNTWHGTPLKTLGKAIKGERFAIGNAQRNFLQADLLLYPNEYTRDIFMRDYMIENFGTAHVAVTGYPRNEVFCGAEAASRSEEDCECWAYLPTWRGIVGKVDKKAQTDCLKICCDELEERLETVKDRNIVVYIKLHPMLRDSLSINGYKHVQTFPDYVPMYEFLAATDGLITDYSSIMFDYAVMGRKIVLYTYDEEEYLADRGMYFGMDELPFPRVRTIAALTEEMLSPKNYDDSGFVKKFCPYDRVGVTKELLHNFMFTDMDMYPRVPSNGLKNVVVYGGDFVRNGIATACTNLMGRVDTKKYNYLVLYKLSPKTNNQPGFHEPALDDIPDNIATLGMTNPHCGTFGELVWTKLWKRLQRLIPSLPFKSAKRAYERIARREAVKTFGGARIDAAVQFNGYFPDVIEMFKVCDCGRAIYVHNDMNGENHKSFAVPWKLLAEAYAKYDEVAVVTDELAPRMSEYMIKGGQSSRKFTTSLNTIDYESIIARAQEPLSFTEQTEADITADELQKILDSDDIKLINIGRFSPEKGQIRLIEAFEKAVRDCDTKAAGDQNMRKARLIILGSYGVEYNNIKERAVSSPYADRITIIKFMANPYPLLRQCDFFVLSSIYEGFGLVLCEADILGVPCFSPRITGPTAFMEKYGGMLVEDSVTGIADGIARCIRGEVKKTLQCDYAEYNKEAVKQFEDMVGRLTE